jgi:predicted O-linked N-acetylglucosamine transferase (SPINDLY family)
MKKLIYTLFFLCSLPAFAFSQTLLECETNYEKACALEVKMMDDIKSIEAQEDSIQLAIANLVIAANNLKSRKHDIVCRLPIVSKDKQNLLSCINIEKNKVSIDALSAKLIEVMNELNRIRSASPIIKPACLGGNCN